MQVISSKTHDDPSIAKNETAQKCDLPEAGVGSVEGPSHESESNQEREEATADGQCESATNVASNEAFFLRELVSALLG